MIFKTENETIRLNQAEEYLKRVIEFECLYDEVRAQYPSDKICLLFLYERTHTIQ